MIDAEFIAVEELPARHGFFTRRGGVSVGPYASLNCALLGQDSREAVAENRARAARRLGADPARLVTLTQVHGTAVVRVETPWLPGQGPRADAAVSDRQGIAIGIVTADCAPVLFADPIAGVVAGAHAGWKGAVAGVLEATLAAMEEMGARRERIVAAIGPCIGQPSYEVAADLQQAVLSHDPADARFFAAGRRPERWQFDLAGYCAHRLHVAGAARVIAMGVDTMADEDRFFSHRRRTLAGGGAIGHQISVITL